jgi:hypothetical protein
MHYLNNVEGFYVVMIEVILVKQARDHSCYVSMMLGEQMSLEFGDPKAAYSAGAHTV